MKSTARKSTAGLGVVAVVATLLAGAARAAEGVPSGWGGLEFGMSVADARQAQPGLELLRDVGAEQAANPDVQSSDVSVPLGLYRLTGQKVLSFQDCTVQTRFFADQLYFIQFDCGRSIEARKALEKAYGVPTQDLGSAGVYWRAGGRSVSLNPRSQVFAYFHNELEQQAVMQIIKAADASKAAAEVPAAEPEPTEPGPTGGEAQE